MFRCLIVAAAIAVVYGNDAFRDAAAPQPQPAAPQADRLAIERTLDAQRQSRLDREQENRNREVEEAKKRFLETERLAQEKLVKDRELRVQEGRRRIQEHNLIDQRERLKERDEFWKALVLADQAQFFKQNPPRNFNGQPRPAQPIAGAAPNP